jgi:hypothetical protein
MSYSRMNKMKKAINPKVKALESTKPEPGAKEWRRNRFPRVSHLKVTRDKALDWCIKKYKALIPEVLSDYGLHLKNGYVRDKDDTTIIWIRGCWDCPLCTHYRKDLNDGTPSHNCLHCPISVFCGTTCDTSGAWRSFVDNNDPGPMLHLLMRTKAIQKGSLKAKEKLEKAT